MSKIAPSITSAVATAKTQISGFYSDQELYQAKNQSKQQQKKKSSKQKGPYLMGQTIGEGAFAKVKIATHIQTNEKVAIKILDKSKFFKDIEDINRVEKEIAILKKLKHKNIIQLYEIMESQKNLYIVMEYCEGKELFDFIVKKRKLSELEACKFFQEIINALEYLHLHKITHRDLKPENLLLDFSQNIKISDFGLSTTYKKGVFLSTPCGTPNYAPPEMLRGDAYNGQLSDVWSCGVILYAMLCGYLPFSESKEQIIYQKIMEHDYEYPSFLSDLVVDLLKKILNVNVNERLDIKGIKKHAWFNSLEPCLKPGISVGKMAIPVDERILHQVGSLGIDVEVCRSKVIANKFDSVSTVYYLCMRRFIKEGGKSNSDLNSSIFLEYVHQERERLGIKDEVAEAQNCDQETENNQNDKSATEREAAIRTENGEEIGLVANDRYSEINQNLNTNEDFVDPANAEVDVIDENIESHKSLLIENEIISRLQKNSLSDRANKSKIKFFQETQKIQAETNIVKCEAEFSPNKNPFLGEKANATASKKFKNAEKIEKNNQEHSLNNTINNFNIDDFYGKTRNNISKNFTNPLSSRTQESKENTFFIVNDKNNHNYDIYNKNFNEKPNYKKEHKISFAENSDSETKNIVNTYNENYTNENNENQKSKLENYENIIEIVANLNQQKNALNCNNRFNENEMNLNSERSGNYSRKAFNYLEEKNQSFLNSDSQRISFAAGANEEINSKSNVNLITEINYLYLNKNNFNKENVIFSGNIGKDNCDEFTFNRSNNNVKENLVSANEISNYKANSESKVNNSIKPKNIFAINKNNFFNKNKSQSIHNSNSQIINNNNVSNNKINSSKYKNELQNPKQISKIAITNNPSIRHNKNIFNINNNTNKNNNNNNNNMNININSILDKNLIIKNLRKVNTGETENLNSNKNENNNFLIKEDKISKSILNSEGNISCKIRNNSSSNNKSAAKQQQQENSKNKKIKNLVTKIANNIGNDLKIKKQKNLILQNSQIKSFISTKANNAINIYDTNKNSNSNNCNFNNNNNISLLKKANPISFINNFNNNNKNASKNPSFASANNNNNNNNNDLDSEANLFANASSAYSGNKTNKNSFFEKLKLSLTTSNKKDKDKLSLMNYRNSICIPTEAYLSENKKKSLLNSHTKEKDAEHVNFREKLKEYSVSVASPYEIKKGENQNKFFSKENQIKANAFNNNNNNCSSLNRQEKIKENSLNDVTNIKNVKFVNSKDLKENKNVNVNLNETNQTAAFGKCKKVISLNTQIANYTSNNNNYSNNNKFIKKNILSPTNKNKPSNELTANNEATLPAEPLSKNNYFKRNNNINNNKVNFGGSYIESKIIQISKNTNLNSNKIINNKNNESKFTNEFISNKPQSTKNKFKISINKNYVKSPVNTELRSQINVFSNAKINKNNNQNGKLNEKEIVLNVNNDQKSSIIGSIIETYNDNKININVSDNCIENNYIKNKKTDEIDVYVNSNAENENPFLMSESKNNISYNNHLVNSCNYEEIKRMHFNEFMKEYEGEIYYKNKNRNFVNDENNNDNKKDYFAKIQNEDISEQEIDFEEELNKLELYPNINVLEYIANKLVEKSISNMETSIKTTGENSTTVYSNLYKSFFKSESTNNSKKHQTSSIKNSIANSNNSNTISIKDAKETKNELLMCNTENDSFYEDENECYEFDEMISLFNKQFRNIVCNQKLENKDNSIITLENNNNVDNKNVNYENKDGENFYVKTFENKRNNSFIGNNNDDDTYNYNNNKNNNAYLKRVFASEKNLVANAKDQKSIVDSNANNIRSGFNRNMANSFVVSPIAKNANSKSNYNLSNNNNNNASSNNNNNNSNSTKQQINNDPKYSKSFIVKANNLSDKSNLISINNNNNNNNNNKNNNYNVIQAIKNKENINSKSKNKLLRKFPHKTNLNVGKDRNNLAANKNVNNLKANAKTEKKAIKIKEIKEVFNLNNNNNNNKQNLNNLNTQISSVKNSFKDLANNEENSNTPIVKSNSLSNDSSGVINPLNNNYYKKIISSNTSINLNNNNSNGNNNNNYNNFNANSINYFKKEEKSFFADNFNPEVFSSETNINNNNKYNNNHNKDFQRSIRITSNFIDSNASDTNALFNSNYNLSPGKTENNSIHFSPNIICNNYPNPEKAEKKAMHVNKINLTNNLFNKNAVLDISATYDPDLDSRNETSVERSKSINNRNKFIYNMHQMSLSPKRNMNLGSFDAKNNTDRNNNAYNDKFNYNIKTLNLNIRDSSVSSSNSNNFNENAIFTAASNNNYNSGNYDSVRMVDNANDVISNYDLVNFNSNEKNKIPYNLRKNSYGQSSVKPKRFGSIGIISEDDEFNNQNMSLIKSKEPLNSENHKNSSGNNLMKINDNEKIRNKFEHKISAEANKINFEDINNNNEFNKEKRNSLSKILNFNEEFEAKDYFCYNNKNNNNTDCLNWNSAQIKNTIFNGTIKNKTADYSPFKIVNKEINSSSNNISNNNNNHIGSNCSSKGSSVNKNYKKNAYQIEKRVTIDLANSINNNNNNNNNK